MPNKLIIAVDEPEN